MKKLAFYSLLFLIFSCIDKRNDDLILIETTKGTITIKLYEDTPLHSKNFIELAKNGTLDSLLFHRVIENFMIQGGDIESKNAPNGIELGNGDLDYTLPAEINNNRFHKKGVLAAARTNNPDRNSSSTQFYLVQGRVFNDSTLLLAEKRINRYLQGYYFIQDPENMDLKKLLMDLDDQEANSSYIASSKKWRESSKEYQDFPHYKIPEDHREIYKSVGGTPHLDQSYTVFGEIVDGLEVVDEIAKAKTDQNDRPIQDIKILSVRMLD